MAGQSQYSVRQFTDEQLMLLISSGTNPVTAEQAFEEIFSRYNQRVVAWCYRVTKNHDLARDLGQEVFLKAFRHCAAFRGDSRLSTWLYSIARNHCLSALKRRPAETLPLDAMTGRNLCDRSLPQPGELAERRELCSMVLRMMHRTLEPMEIRVMTLHYAHEVPLATITRQLELTNPSGAKAYIVNARRKLNGAVRRRGWDVALADPVTCWPTQAAA